MYRKFELKKEVRYMKMEQANYIKAIFTAVFAFLSALLGVLAVPVIDVYKRQDYRCAAGGKVGLIE